MRVGTWCESYLSYHGRSHGHAETKYEAWSKQVCCEKSAKATAKFINHDQKKTCNNYRRYAISNSTVTVCTSEVRP